MYMILLLVYIRWYNGTKHSVVTCSEKRKNPSNRSERSSHGLFSSVPSSSSPEVSFLHKICSQRVVHKGYKSWRGNLIWVHAAAQLPESREQGWENVSNRQPTCVAGEASRLGTPCLAAKCFSREGISGSVCVSWQARQRKAWSVLSIDIWKEIDKELVEDKWRQNFDTMEEVKHFWIFYYNKIKLPKIKSNLEISPRWPPPPFLNLGLLS